MAIRHPKEIMGIMKDPDITVSSTPFIEHGGDKGFGQHLNFCLYVKKSVDWKGNAFAMPAAAKAGLHKAVDTSKGAVDVLGTAIDTATGRLIPRKGLRQRELGAAVRMPAEERRRRARAYRAPGTVPIESLR